MVQQQKQNADKHQSSERHLICQFPGILFVCGLFSVTGMNHYGLYKESWFLVSSNHKFQAGFYTLRVLNKASLIHRLSQLKTFRKKKNLCLGVAKGGFSL